MQNKYLFEVWQVGLVWLSGLAWGSSSETTHLAKMPSSHALMALAVNSPQTCFLQTVNTHEKEKVLVQTSLDCVASLRQLNP